MKRGIKIEVVAEVAGMTFFKVHSTRTGWNLTLCGDTFGASNGIAISSIAYPVWDKADHIFVNGTVTELDDMILEAINSDFKKIKAAIEEYNKLYSYSPEFEFLTLCSSKSADQICREQEEFRKLSENEAFKNELIELTEDRLIECGFKVAYDSIKKITVKRNYATAYCTASKKGEEFTILLYSALCKEQNYALYPDGMDICKKL